MSSSQNQFSKSNNNLYSLYINTFDKLIKYSNKKDGNLNTLKDLYSKLQTSKDTFNQDFNQIKTFSLTIVQPVDQSNIKIMETILETMVIILTNNLLNTSILQEMCEILILYIHKFFQNKENDFNLNQKILYICQLIYTNKNLFIHNDKFKYVIKICLTVYLLDTQNLNENQRNNGEKTLSFFIDTILKNMLVISRSSSNNNKYTISYTTSLFKQKNKKIIDKQEFLRRLQLNDFIFITSKYLNFILDLFEIQSLNQNIELWKKYIKIINEQNYNLLKTELENLNLPALTEYSEMNKEKPGKYGWCIFCHNTSNYWNEKYNLPLCNEETCGKEYNNYINNLYPRIDFLNMLIYLSKNSIIGSLNEDNNEKNFQCRHLCIELVKNMIEKSSKFFQNDKDLIIIIKDIFKDCLLRNSLSSDIKIFQQCLELFNCIFRNYRSNLKEQIEIYFMKVFITFLESENIEFDFKDAVIENLIKLTKSSQFLIEIYINYDCDINCTALFCVLINLLTKIMNGLYKKVKYQNTFKNAQENSILVSKTFKFLNIFIKDTSDLVQKNFEAINDSKKQKNFNISEKNLPNFEDNNENNVNTSEFKDKISKNLYIKKLLEKAIELFNIGKSSSDCYRFLQKEKMIFSEKSFNKMKNTYINDFNNNTIQDNYRKIFTQDENTIISEMASDDLSIITTTTNNINIMETPFISNINPLIFFILDEDKEKLPNTTYENYTAFEMARFIRTNLKELIRERVGDYLCSGKNFNIQVMHYFINSFDFKEKNILDAMRILFMELPLSGEAQVIDRVVQTFGEKFHKQNPNELGNPDYCYYLAFSLLQLNTDLHRDEIEKKMTIKEFINAVNLTTNGEKKISEKYLENLYNEVLNDPLVIPGQILNQVSKSKKDLIQIEKEKIRKITTHQFNNINTKTKNYITDIGNDNIRHLIDFSWSNFLSIYSQVLNENDNNYLHVCIEKILLLAKICSRLKINTAHEVFINTIISLINLDEKNEINLFKIDCIQSFLNYINTNGKFIRTGWFNILQLISKLDYFLTSETLTIVENMKNSKTSKYNDKEIQLFLNKKEILKENVSDNNCEKIFSITEFFDEESLINFILGLCEVSKIELKDYYSPRVFSLHKLVEVADFNIGRIQAQWVKIWKLISDYLVYVISSSEHENIWKEAIESLRQTVCKLLQKRDISIYNFQTDFFKPFEIIFSQTEGKAERGETVINFLYYIIGQYGKYIHSGWIVIFRILKSAFRRNDPKINEYIKGTLQKIYEDGDIINGYNREVFKMYIECLCYMYTDKTMKQFAFDTILNLLSKIMNDPNNNIFCFNEEEKDTKSNVMQLPNANKKYDFLKIFFYGFDDLIKINLVDHLNLLFEIISHNKKLIFSRDYYSFLYMYFSYFKPHLVTLLLVNYVNRFSLTESINKNNYFDELKDNNKIEDNIRLYLNYSIDNLIKDFGEEKSKEYDQIFISDSKKNDKKRALIGFLREVKEEYNKEEIFENIKKKIDEFSSINEENYETAIRYFLEKFKSMYTNENNETENLINYNYFYEDLIYSINKLFIINKNSETLFKINEKILINPIQNQKNNISLNTIDKLNEVNIFVLNTLSMAKTCVESEESLHKLIIFNLTYANYFLNFIQNYPSDVITEYKLITKIFYKILQIDLEEKNKETLKKYKIINSSSTIVLLIKLQDIQSFILNKIEKEKYVELYDKNGINDLNILIKLNEIYNKYQVAKEENSLINKVLIYDVENILPRFIKLFPDDELQKIYECIINFIGSVHHNLRRVSKDLLKLFVEYNLISFGDNK